MQPQFIMLGFSVFFLPDNVTEITSDQLINSVTQFCIVTKHDHECYFSFAALSPLCLFLPWCEFSVTWGDGNTFSLLSFCVCEVAMAGLIETIAAGVSSVEASSFLQPTYYRNSYAPLECQICCKHCGSSLAQPNSLHFAKNSVVPASHRSSCFSPCGGRKHFNPSGCCRLQLEAGSVL